MHSSRVQAGKDQEVIDSFITASLQRAAFMHGSAESINIGQASFRDPGANRFNTG